MREITLVGALVASTFLLKLSQVIDVRSGHQLWFAFFALIICLVFPYKKDRKTFVLLYFLPASFVLGDNIWSAYTYFQWFLQSLGIIALLKISSVELDRKILEKAFVFVCLAQCAWVFLEYFRIDIYQEFIGLFSNKVQRLSNIGKDWEIIHKKRIIGSLGNPTTTATLVSILTPFVYKLKKYLVIFPVFALYLLDGTMGVLSAYVSFIFIFSYNSRFKAHLFFIHVIAFCALLYYGNATNGFFSDSARLINWYEILRAHGLDNPIFGGGPGFLENLAFQIDDQHEIFRPEHNEFLTLYLQYGIVGLAIVFYFIKIKLIEFNKENDVFFKASLVALLFNCLGTFPLHIASTGLIAIILIGQLNKETAWQRPQQKRKS